MKKTLIILASLISFKSAIANDLDIAITNNYLDENSYQNATINIAQGTSISADNDVNIMTRNGFIENLDITNNGSLTSNQIANIYIQGETRNASIVNNGSLTTNDYVNIYFDGFGKDSGQSTASVVNYGTISSNESNIRAISRLEYDLNFEDVHYNYDFELNNYGLIQSNDQLENYSISIILNEDLTNNATIINSGENARIISENHKAIAIENANIFTLSNLKADNLSLENSNTKIEGANSAIDVSANSYQIINSAIIENSSAQATVKISEVTNNSSINNSGQIINEGQGAAISSLADSGNIEITNSGLISSAGDIAIYATNSDNFTLNILQGSQINGQVYATVNQGGSLNLNILANLDANEYSALRAQIASIDSYLISLNSSNSLIINDSQTTSAIRVSGGLENSGQIGTLDLVNGNITNSGTINNLNFDANNANSTVNLRDGSTTNFLSINGSGNQINFYQGASVGQINNNSATNFNFIDGNYEFTNNLNGAGNITLDGNHMVVISGNNALTGNIIANNSELKINGSTAGNVIINNGSILSGNGSVQNLTLNAGAVIAPGNSIGTLNVNSVSYNNSTISNFEFNRLNIDKVVAAQNATIDGILNLNIYQDSGDFVVSRNIIESTNGNISGQFSQINVENNYAASLDYQGQAVRATIASKINSNILDSQIFLQNNLVNLVQNNIKNQLQSSNIKEGKFKTWINFEGFENKRENLEDSRSFKSNGQLIAAGFIYAGQSLDFAATIFSSFSKINRGYYLGQEDVNSNGASITLSKKYQNFSNYLEVGGGILNGDFARQVLINNQMENSKAKISGDFGYLTLGATYNYNKNIGFRGDTTLQRVRINNINETGLTHANLAISANKANSLNFEIANFYQGNINLAGKFFKENNYQFEISANHGQLINSKNVLITQENTSYNLTTQYNQGFIFGVAAQINSRISQDLLLSLKVKRRQNNNFYENNASFNLRFDF
jgi:hypothetical protein